MKKVKTLITSLFVIFASAFMTACSCGGGAGKVDPGNIEPVYEQGIDINCDHASTVKDEETGYLTIRVHLNDEFKITYDLRPLDVTTTQVDWTFVENDDVAVSKSNSYTYSQERSHTITFVAKNVGNTLLQFKTKATSKITQARIIVGDAPQVLPRFVEVKGLNYVAETGKLIWSPVTQQQLHTKEIVDAPTTNGQVSGLTGYELQITDLTNDVTLDPITVSKCEYTLPRGITYAVKVRALGDGIGDGYGFTVSDGPFQEEPFKFHQISTATELKNINGTISYNTPIHSFENRIYFNASDRSMFITRGIDSRNSAKLDSFDYSIFGDRAKDLSAYDFSVVSYPEHYDSQLGYYYDVNSKIRYYASLETDKIHVEKLSTPRVYMSDKRENREVGGVLFEDIEGSRAYISSLINWEIDKQYQTDIYGVKFAYAVYKDNTRIIPANEEYQLTEDGYFDLSTLWGNPAGLYKIVVFATGKESTTISSPKVEFLVNVLGVMDRDDCTINLHGENRLATSSANAVIAGADLFFVNQGKGKSLHHFVSTFNGISYHSTSAIIDLTTLNLEAGEYRVYGRFVGVKGDGTNHSNTSATSNLIEMLASPIRIEKAPNSREIASNGTIKFSQVSNVNDYVVRLAQYDMYDNPTGTPIIVQLSRAEGSYSLDNIYRSYTNLRYTLLDGYGYINVRDILGNKLLISGIATEDNLESYIDQYLNNSKFTFEVASKGTNESAVDSAYTTSVLFTRREGVSSATLERKEVATERKFSETLKFSNIYTQSTYVIEIGDKKFNYISGTESTIEIDLNSVKAIGETADKYMSDYIDKSLSANAIKITVLGEKGTTIGQLDSLTASIGIEVTGKPSSVAVDSLGILTWNSVLSASDTSKTFYLKIYDGVSAEPTTQKIPSPNMVANEEVENYSYNISDILETMENTVVGIAVEEQQTTKFTGEISDKHYVLKLSKVGASRVYSGSNPAIKIDKVSNLANLEYDIIVTDELLNKTTYTNSSDGTYLLTALGKDGEDKDIGITEVGKYQINVVVRPKALAENPANSDSTPTIINSHESTTLNVEIVSSSITTTTDGTNISWTSIHEDADYELRYKGILEESYTSVDNSANTKATSYPSPLTLAGSYHIKVVPTVTEDVYNTSGLVLLDDAIQNNIEKLPQVQVSTFATEEGKITFTVDSEYVNTNRETMGIIISANGAVLNSKDYSLSYAQVPAVAPIDDPADPEPTPTPVSNVVKFTITILSTNKTLTVDANTVAVSLTHEGAINGDISAEFSVNRIGYSAPADTDFTKKQYSESVTIESETTIVKVDRLEWNIIPNASVYKIIVTKVLPEVTTPVTPEIPAPAEEGSAKTNVESYYVKHTKEGDPLADVLYIGKMSEGATEVTYTVATEDQARIEGGKILLNFNQISLVTIATDYIFTIEAMTTVDGYINGQQSDKLTITKLNNPVEITTSGNKIEFGNLTEYIGLTDQQLAKAPSRVIYSIEGFKTIVTPGIDGADDTSEKISLGIHTNDELSFAEFIALAVDGKVSVNVDDLENGKFKTAETFRVSIQFIGNNGIVMDSDVVEIDNINRLGQVVLGTDKGTIVWQPILGASSYDVIIQDDQGIEYKINNYLMPTPVVNTLTTTPEGEGEEEEKTTYIKLSESSILTAVDGEGNLITFLAGSEYKIRVLAKASNCLSSLESVEFKVMKLLAPNALKVEREDISVGAPLIKWANPNELANRNLYELAYFNGETIARAREINATADPNATVEGFALDTDMPVLKDAQGNLQSYILKMKVIGNTTIGDTSQLGLLTSDYSSVSSSIKYVYEANNVGYRDNGAGIVSYTWDAVPNSIYQLKFQDASGNTKFTTNVSNNYYEFKNTEFAGSGYYKLIVNAITDPAYSIVSTYIETGEGAKVINNEATLYKTKSVEEVFVKDGSIAWLIPISEIATFVDPHVSDENSVLFKHFNGIVDTEGGEEAQEEGGEEPTPIVAITKDEFVNKTVEYILGIIKETIEEKDVNPAVTNALNHFFKFRIQLNGAETEITAKAVNAMRIKNSERIYTQIYSDYASTETDYTKYLMYTFDIVNEVIGTDTLVPIPGCYDVNITSIGNMNIDASTVVTTDAKYNQDNLRTVFKPITPSTYLYKVNEGGQLIDTPENQLIKQIDDGYLLWELVTNADSDDVSFQYHKDYKLTVTANDSSIYVKIKIGNKISGTTYNVEITNSNGIKNEDVTTMTIENDCYCRLDLKTIFKGTIATNTNYNLTLSVLGTEDSSVLDSDANLYINSNKFQYTDQLNILDNKNIEVTDSRFKWDHVADATSTRIVIYGPFDYAPDPDTYLEEDEYKTATSYENALYMWKSNYVSQYFSDTSKFGTNGVLKREYTIGADQQFMIINGDLQVVDNKQNATPETPAPAEELPDVNVVPVRSFTITNAIHFDAGTYIIRKQEIGNGKGIISTDFEEKDNLGIKNGDESYEPYGVIATKLDQITQVSKLVQEKQTWVHDGRFEWNPVTQANAYNITIEKLDANKKVVDSATQDMGLVRETYYEMPDLSEFNDTLYSYRLKVTAKRVEDGVDINGNSAIIENFFSGDIKETDNYGRTAKPSNITVSNGIIGDDGEVVNGLVAWDAEGNNESTKEYQAQATFNGNNGILINVPTLTKTYDLTQLPSNGEIIFRVRSLAHDNILNSAFSIPLFVHKTPDPNPRLDKGLFTWSPTATSQNPTESILKIYVGDDKDPMNAEDGMNTEFVYNQAIQNYPLYTEIAGFDDAYVLADDLAKYPENVNYTFTVQFMGDKGTFTVDKFSPENPFEIASSEYEYTATKLKAPTIDNAPKDPSNPEASSNILTWSKDSKASAYRVLVLVKPYEAVAGQDSEPQITEYNLYTNNPEDSKYFEIGADEVQFKITEILDTMGTVTDNGVNMRIYVQAVGSDTDGAGYLSSSFSDVKAIAVPAAPIDCSYDNETGTLSWSLQEGTQGNPFNAIIKMTYVVENITDDQYNNYWMKTKDGEPNARENRYSEIISRTFSRDGNTLTVRDVVFLNCTQNKQKEWIVPTEYQLTHIAKYQSFSVIITAGDDKTTSDDSYEYKSRPLEWTRDESNIINLSIFGGGSTSGDGSQTLPYIVTNEIELNRIRNFTDKHFVITNDITLTNNWYIIEDEFTGSIIGSPITVSAGVTRNPIIKNVIMLDIRNNSQSIEKENKIMLAFMNTNAGVIRNIDLEIDYESDTSAMTHKTLVAGLAITNAEGAIIDNVHVRGSIFVNVAESDGTEASGMVIYNNGSIIDSSVTVYSNNTAGDPRGIYALDKAGQNGDIQSRATGIAGYNYGTISGSKFKGDITSNFVGGIAGNNYGIIDNCEVEDGSNANLVDTDAVNSTDNLRSIEFGGIATQIYNGATITNSNSNMSVHVTKTFTSSQAYIGGLVGSVMEDRDIASKTITLTDNTVVVDFTVYTGSVNGAYAVISNEKGASGTLITTYTNNTYSVKALNNVTLDENPDGVAQI